MPYLGALKVSSQCNSINTIQDSSSCRRLSWNRGVGGSTTTENTNAACVAATVSHCPFMYSLNGKLTPSNLHGTIILDQVGFSLYFWCYYKKCFWENRDDG